MKNNLLYDNFHHPCTIKNANVTFDNNRVLHNFSMDWGKSGITCLFGRSGCGKSTLLKAIAGLIPYGGKNTEHKVSFVFQEDRLLPWFNALENVACVQNNSNENALDILNKLKLVDGAEELLPSELSGGMRARVNIARSLYYEFSLLIMDEPFNGLDDLLKYDIMKYIREKLRGRPCLFVTHDRREAISFSDEIIILDGPPLTIKNRFLILKKDCNEMSKDFYSHYEKYFEDLR